MELRVIGTKSEIKGFEKHLTQDKKYDIESSSKIYQVHDSKSKYRKYFGITKSNVKKASNENGGTNNE